jgi:hypothetical protein
VIILRDIEGQSAEDACALLGISSENQRVLLHRARNRVRTAIDAIGGATSTPVRRPKSSPTIKSFLVLFFKKEQERLFSFFEKKEAKKLFPFRGLCLASPA